MRYQLTRDYIRCLLVGSKYQQKKKKKKGNGMGGEGGAEDGLGNCPPECRISFTIKSN